MKFQIILLRDSITYYRFVGREDVRRTSSPPTVLRRGEAWSSFYSRNCIRIGRIHKKREKNGLKNSYAKGYEGGGFPGRENRKGGKGGTVIETIPRTNPKRVPWFGFERAI